MDSTDVNYYWTTINKALDSIGRYEQAAKLHDNLDDPNTEWQVREVFAKYYNGEIGKLNAKIAREKGDFFYYIGKINGFCNRRNLQIITNTEKLFELLRDSKRRNYYRKKVKSYLDKGIFVPLQSIEKDFTSK